MERCDAEYMRRALSLAGKAQGRTSPNPLVGAVIVNSGMVVGEGYHEAAGKAHAEVLAIENAGEAAEGATLYVTLEPCDHQGRTPPCTKAIIKAGISRVVIALRDPNPESAAGIETLEANNVETTVGLCAERAATLNEAFLTAVRERRPFVVAKTAMTLDGKIATRTRNSAWISNSHSRRFGHELRDRYDAILVGAGTVRSDDPRLTARLDRETRDPIRVVLSADLDIPTDATVVTEHGKTIVATLEARREDRGAKIERFRGLVGVEMLFISTRDVSALLTSLFDRSIQSLVLEGGAETNWSFYERGLVDKLHTVIAPKIIGGRDSVPAVGGTGFERIEEAIELPDLYIDRFEEDVLLTGYPNGPVRPKEYGTKREMNTTKSDTMARTERQIEDENNRN